MSEPNPYERTKAAISEALQRVEAHAPDEWNAAAFLAVVWCARIYPEFTADEVWIRLGMQGVDSTDVTHSALGPVFLHAKYLGIIENTGRKQKLSNRSCRHGDMTIWHSCSCTINNQWPWQ
jgi:hypothetical protein